jgi:hypothetical protein
MWHVFVNSLGITAAILMIGGYILLQWQRNRYRYRLMQIALERGIANFSEGPPFWVISLRRGISILALGIGLMIVGGIAVALARSVEQPNAAIVRTSETKKGQEDSSASAADEMIQKLLRLDLPRPPGPAMERWRQAQIQENVALAATGCGFLMTLLGFVGTAFAFVERKHFRNNGQPPA